MPLPSGITSVDTVQVLPASEAFVSGQLLQDTFAPSPEDIFLPADSSAVTVPASVPRQESWTDSPANTGVMILCIVIMLAYMRKFMKVFPYLAGGLFRWKLIAELEHYIKMARLRDSLLLPSFIIFCTVLARFSVFMPAPALSCSPIVKTLSVFGLFASVLTVKWLLIMIIPSRRMGTSRDAVVVSVGAGRDFFLLMTAGLAAVLLAATFFPGREMLMGEVSIYVILSFWVLFLVRKMQILSADAGLLRAFLYLCTVEVPPAAMLVASMMFL